MKTSIIYLILLTALPLTSRECLNEAYKLYVNQKYQESINTVNSCLIDIENEADPEEMDYAYFGLSSNYLSLGLIDSSLKYTLIAYNIEKTNDLPTSKTLNQLGSLYIKKGLNHQAIYYLKKAVEINISDDNKSFLQKDYNNLGIAYHEIGIIDSSLFFYNLSLSLTEVGESDYNIIKNNLATLYFTNGNYNKSKMILDEISYNHLSNNTKVEKYLVLSNKVLFKLLTDQTISKKESAILNDYLEYCSTRNDFFTADAYSKLSIYTLLEGDIDKGIDYLNNANDTYVALGNIGLAKEVTSRFSKLMTGSPNEPFRYSLNELNEKQIEIYSKSLYSEIETKLKAEEYIGDLKIKVNKAEFSYYITLSLFISMILFIVIVFQKIRSSKRIQQVINGYVSYLNLINQLDSKRLRNNLSKINNYMILDESFNNKKYFTELIDEVVKDTNNIRKTVKEGIIFQETKRLKNVNITTTD